MESALSPIGRLLSKVFRYEPIGRDEVAYLDRWVLARVGDRRLYLHHFRSDDPEAPHNHPRVFLSFLFSGSYREEVFSEEGGSTTHFFRAPYFRSFPPGHAHRISECRGAWSLVLVGRRRQDWGFWAGEEWRRPEPLVKTRRETPN